MVRLKKKREVNRLINYLFTKYRVKKIPIKIHWKHSAISAEAEMAFGMFRWYDNGDAEIHVAGKGIGKAGVIELIAHEFVHYMQWINKKEMSEEEAEKGAILIKEEWVARKKR